MRAHGMVKTHAVYPLATLAGGLWLDESPLTAPDGCADIAHNLLVNPDNSLSARPGARELYAALPGTPEVQLLREVNYGGVNYLLRVYSNGEVYLDLLLAGTIEAGSGSVQVWNVGPRVFVTRGDSQSYNKVYELTGYPPTLYELAPGQAGVTQTFDPPFDPTGYTGEVVEYEYRVTGFDSAGNESPSLADALMRHYAGSSVVDQTLTFSISAAAPYTVFNVYRKNPDSDLYLLLEQKTATVSGGLKTFSVNAGYARPLQARVAPDLVFMSGRGISCLSANRVWTVRDGKLYYSNPFDPTARDALAVENISLPDGGIPTAIAPFNQGVIIFSPRSAAYVTGPPMFGGQLLPLGLNVGAVSQNAWTYVDSQLVFVGPDNIYAFNGSAAQPIGRGIQKLIRELDYPAELTLTYVPDLRALVLAYARAPLLLLCMNGERPSAVTWEHMSRAAARYQEKLVVGHAGKVLVYDFDYDTPNLPVHLHWRSTPLAFGDPSIWKLYRRAEAYFTAQGVTSFTLALNEVLGDGQRFEETVNATATTALGRVRVPANLQGRYVQVEVKADVRQANRPLVAPPINIEFRSRDRMGR